MCDLGDAKKEHSEGPREREDGRGAASVRAPCRTKEKSLNAKCVQTQSNGMSGDTELFKKTSNIKCLWTSKQKIILYIPLLWGGCFEAAALS